MRIKIFSFLAVALSLFIGNVVRAQSPSQNQQTIQTAISPSGRNKLIEADVNRDLARIDSVVRLSNDQKSMLKESFENIVRKKYVNSQTTDSNNSVDITTLDKEVAKEEIDELEDILRPKQLKVWDKAQGVMPISGSSGTH